MQCLHLKNILSTGGVSFFSSNNSMSETSRILKSILSFLSLYMILMVPSLSILMTSLRVESTQDKNRAFICFARFCLTLLVWQKEAAEQKRNAVRITIFFIGFGNHWVVNEIKPNILSMNWNCFFTGVYPGIHLPNLPF